MPDFGSALYLGLRHPSATLGAWDALTLGRPAGSADPPGSRALAAGLARLAGTGAATLLPSTLHLFFDLLALLGTQRIVLLLDDACYPVARWGAEQAAARGTPLQSFPHGSASGALRAATAAARAGRRPVLVADGWFAGGGTAPPLRAYADIARRFDGYLVLDDTQAFGLFGHAPGGGAPYGAGGGGSLPLHGLAGPHVVLGASLAKAFGAPCAVLAGDADLVRRFEAGSATRRHSSPPSVAAIRAGLGALRLNRTHGEALRARLWGLVALWRDGLARHGLAARGGSFPVQTLELAPRVDGVRLHQLLRGAGIETVLQRDDGRATVSFLFRADHGGADIERAVTALAACLRRPGSTTSARLEAL
ncbi:aminotransferase class I/II-fold pyridoxal phosphate-dependent enzyme [Massilia consociata]|uniref:Aminotransferase class I/II-fold pyridoxal phosphate-dependent enzyme n=1 Tax=Massilia consociata TaxID=760117 RepID=A0ABV6FK13_9BURK